MRLYDRTHLKVRVYDCTHLKVRLYEGLDYRATGVRVSLFFSPADRVNSVPDD